ncbi:MAG TPA: radical SAM protein [Thermodesulfobacteriota bacterium]
MLSISKLLGTGIGRRASAAESARYQREDRPVVVWNVTRSCPLSCVHCYNDSGKKTYPGELSTKEAISVIDSLASFQVPAIIFSGGDPLERPDIFELIEYAGSKGVRTILSTNGILSDKETAQRIKDSGIVYVGVSIDGGEEINDRLRGMRGGFRKAVDGMRLCRDLGLVVGVRFTMSKKTVGELPFIFDLMDTEGIHRGYFAHLVYAGRGEKFSREDLDHEETRKAVDYIFDRAESFIKAGSKKDIVLGSNDVDGVYLYLRLLRTDPEKAATVKRLLIGRGGNSSGVSLGNIDNLGFVHADQFWSHHSFGNVKESSFEEIWLGSKDPLFLALKDRKRFVKGRCARCPFFDICGGNYRVRAEFATGDIWAEDPACYLSNDELGIR